MQAAAQALTDVQSAALSDNMTVSITYNNGIEQVIALTPLSGPNDVISTAETTSPAQTLQPRIQDADLPSAGPSGRMAYLYDVISSMSYARLGTTITDASQDTPVAPLTSWFENATYAVTNSLQFQPPSNGTPVTIFNSANAQILEASVLFLHTHGAYFGKEAPYTYVLATAYAANAANINSFYDQLISTPTNPVTYPTMVVFTYPLNYVDSTTDIRIKSLTNLLAVTPLYVIANMTFEQNSVVFSDSCSLMRGYPPPVPTPDPYALASQAMVQAFFTAGAGAVLGWDQDSNLVQAADSAMYFFDRVLGAGADGVPGGYGSAGVPHGYLAYPAGDSSGNPANRPFDIGAVFEEMNITPRQSNDQPSAVFVNVEGLAPIANLNLNQTVVIDITQDPNTLVYTPAPGAVPIIATLQMQLNPNDNDLTGTPALMPTIAAVSLLNNQNQLTITGDFGGEYTNRSITIGGTDVTASATWTSGQITINNLPLSGPGSSGKILVTIDGLQSNHLLLNQWNDIPLTMITNNGPSIERTVSCDIDLRASFDTLRAGPDEAPETDLVTTDNAVLENGVCEFTSTNPIALNVDIPWINPYTPNGQPFPATGADAYAPNPTQDGQGGGSMALSLQAGYCNQPQGGLFCFLDTAATPAAGPGAANQLVFSDGTQNLATGTAPQQLGSLSWMSTPGLTPDPLEAR